MGSGWFDRPTTVETGPSVAREGWTGGLLSAREVVDRGHGGDDARPYRGHRRRGPKRT